MGILPLLMKKLVSLGLVYRRCVTSDHQGSVKLTVSCVGELNCDKEYLVKILEEIPDVTSVISVLTSKANVQDFVDTKSVNDDKLMRNENGTKSSLFHATDELNHDVMFMVEDRLSEILGPVTKILIRKAEKKSKLVGELFLYLSEELTEDQKNGFLRNVVGLEKITLNNSEAM